MKVGDLVKDRHGNFGTIVRQRGGYDNYVWVLWDCGSETTINKIYLYKVRT